jgi:hypothetical protein
MAFNVVENTFSMLKAADDQIQSLSLQLQIRKAQAAQESLYAQSIGLTGINELNTLLSGLKGSSSSVGASANLMSMLIGPLLASLTSGSAAKTNVQDEDFNEEYEDYLADMDASTAAKYMYDNFDLLIGEDDDEDDANLTRTKLNNVASTTDDPELKAAIKWFLKSSNSASKKELTGTDNKLTKAELATFYNNHLPTGATAITVNAGTGTGGNTGAGGNTGVDNTVANSTNDEQEQVLSWIKSNFTTFDTNPADGVLDSTEMANIVAPTTGTYATESFRIALTNIKSTSEILGYASQGDSNNNKVLSDSMGVSANDLTSASTYLAANGNKTVSDYTTAKTVELSTNWNVGTAQVSSKIASTRAIMAQVNTQVASSRQFVAQAQTALTAGNITSAQTALSSAKASASQLSQINTASLDSASVTAISGYKTEINVSITTLNTQIEAAIAAESAKAAAAAAAAATAAAEAAKAAAAENLANESSAVSYLQTNFSAGLKFDADGNKVIDAAEIQKAIASTNDAKLKASLQKILTNEKIFTMSSADSTLGGVEVNGVSSADLTAIASSQADKLTIDQIVTNYLNQVGQTRTVAEAKVDTQRAQYKVVLADQNLLSQITTTKSNITSSLAAAKTALTTNNVSAATESLNQAQSLYATINSMISQITTDPVKTQAASSAAAIPAQIEEVYTAIKTANQIAADASPMSNIAARKKVVIEQTELAKSSLTGADTSRAKTYLANAQSAYNAILEVFQPMITAQSNKDLVAGDLTSLSSLIKAAEAAIASYVAPAPSAEVDAITFLRTNFEKIDSNKDKVLDKSEIGFATLNWKDSNGVPLSSTVKGALNTVTGNTFELIYADTASGLDEENMGLTTNDLAAITEKQSQGQAISTISNNIVAANGGNRAAFEATAAIKEADAMYYKSASNLFSSINIKANAIQTSMDTKTTEAYVKAFTDIPALQKEAVYINTYAAEIVDATAKQKALVLYNTLNMRLQSQFMSIPESVRNAHTETQTLQVLLDSFSSGSSVYDLNKNGILEVSELTAAKSKLTLDSFNIQKLIDGEKEFSGLGTDAGANAVAGISKNDLAEVKRINTEHNLNLTDIARYTYEDNGTSKVAFEAFIDKQRAAAQTTLQQSQPSYDRIQAVVTNLYSDTLGRTPTAAEINDAVSKIANGQTVAAIRTSLETSTEYTNVTLKDRTKLATVVTSLYKDILGRDPDSFGLGYYIDKLAAGTSLAEVRRLMSGGDPSNEFGTTTVKDDAKLTAVVSNLYLETLGRPVDAAGLQIYKDQLIAGTKTLTQIRTELETSGEFNGLRAPAKYVAETKAM